MADNMVGSGTDKLSASLQRAKQLGSESLVKSRNDARELLREQGPGGACEFMLKGLEGVIGSPETKLDENIRKAVNYKKSSFMAAKTPNDIKQSERLIQGAVVNLMLSARSGGDLEYIMQGLTNLVVKMPEDCQESLCNAMLALGKPDSAVVNPPPGNRRIPTMLFHLMNAFSNKYSELENRPTPSQASLGSSPPAPQSVARCIKNAKEESVFFNPDVFVLDSKATTSDDTILIARAGVQSGNISEVSKLDFKRVLQDNGFSPVQIEDMCSQVNAGSIDAVEVPSDYYDRMTTPAEEAVVGVSQVQYVTTASNGQVFKLDTQNWSSAGTQNDRQILVGTKRSSVVVDKAIFRQYLINRGCEPGDVDALCGYFKKDTHESVMVTNQDMVVLRTMQTEAELKASSAAEATPAVSPGFDMSPSIVLSSPEDYMSTMAAVLKYSPTTTDMFSQTFPDGRVLDESGTIADQLVSPSNLMIMAEVLSFNALTGQTNVADGANFLKALREGDYALARKMALKHGKFCHPDKFDDANSPVALKGKAVFQLLGRMNALLTALKTNEGGAQARMASEFGDASGFKSKLSTLMQTEKVASAQDLRREQVAQMRDKYKQFGVKYVSDVNRVYKVEDQHFSQRAMRYFSEPLDWSRSAGFESLSNLDCLACAVCYQDETTIPTNDQRAQAIGDILMAMAPIDGRVDDGSSGLEVLFANLGYAFERFLTAKFPELVTAFKDSEPKPTISAFYAAHRELAAEPTAQNFNFADIYVAQLWNNTPTTYNGRNDLLKGQTLGSREVFLMKFGSPAVGDVV